MNQRADISLESVEQVCEEVAQFLLMVDNTISSNFDFLLSFLPISQSTIGIVSGNNSFVSLASLQAQWHHLSTQINLSIFSYNKSSPPMLVNQFFESIRSMMRHVHSQAPIKSTTKKEHNSAYLDMKKSIESAQICINNGNTQNAVSQLRQIKSDLSRKYYSFFSTAQFGQNNRNNSIKKCRRNCERIVEILTTPNKIIEPIIIPAELKIFSMILIELRMKNENVRLKSSSRSKTPPTNKKKSDNYNLNPKSRTSKTNQSPQQLQTKNSERRSNDQNNTSSNNMKSNKLTNERSKTPPNSRPNSSKGKRGPSKINPTSSFTTKMTNVKNNNHSILNAYDNSKNGAKNFHNFNVFSGSSSSSSFQITDPNAKNDISSTPQKIGNNNNINYNENNNNKNNDGNKNISNDNFSNRKTNDNNIPDKNINNIEHNPLKLINSKIESYKKFANSCDLIQNLSNLMNTLTNNQILDILKEININILEAQNLPTSQQTILEVGKKITELTKDINRKISQNESITNEKDSVFYMKNALRSVKDQQTLKFIEEQITFLKDSRNKLEQIALAQRNSIALLSIKIENERMRLEIKNLHEQQKCDGGKTINNYNCDFSEIRKIHRQIGGINDLLKSERSDKNEQAIGQTLHQLFSKEDRIINQLKRKI